MSIRTLLTATQCAIKMKIIIRDKNSAFIFVPNFIISMFFILFSAFKKQERKYDVKFPKQGKIQQGGEGP